MTRRIVLFCVVGLLTACETPAFAWGNEGHRIVCEIALKRLSPTALKFVDNVRALHTEIKDGFDDCQANSSSPKHPSDARDMSFLEGCIWADESRRDTLANRTIRTDASIVAFRICFLSPGAE